MIDPREIFETINSSGGRAACPKDAPAECESPDKSDMCVQINTAIAATKGGGLAQRMNIT